MLASRRRQASMMRRIAHALTYLRGEATAAALDDVAAAIANAEQSVSLICQNAPLDRRGSAQGRCRRPSIRNSGTRNS
jgi:hypothetical protein